MREIKDDWGAVVMMEAKGETEQEAFEDLRDHLPKQSERVWGIRKLVRLDTEGREVPRD